MSLAQLSLILLTVIALSAGQILFKMAAGSFEFSAAGLINGLLNTKLIIALVVYFFATIMWLFAAQSHSIANCVSFCRFSFLCRSDTCPFLAGREHKLEYFRRGRFDSNWRMGISVSQSNSPFSQGSYCFSLFYLEIAAS